MDELIKYLNDVVKQLDEGKILKNIYAEPKVEQFIVSLNTEGQKTSQLYELGQDADGQSLGNYSPFTIQMKLNGFGDRRIDHITLKDTGEFYETFEVIPKKDGFVIKANPLKDGDDLTEQFGEDIIGLNDNNKEILSEFLAPFLQEKIRSILL